MKEIKQIKLKILSSTHAFKEKINAESLSGFINKNGLILDLDRDVIYLAMAYGCTQSKVKNEFECEETRYENLVEIYNKKLNINIAKKSAQKLVKQWQKRLSFFNINTIQFHAKNVEDGETQLWAKYICSDRYILEDQRGRLCAPSLYTAALIYTQLTKVRGAILGLQVNLIEPPKKYISRFTVYFEVDQCGKLQPIHQEKVPSHCPIYVFAGCRYVADGLDINLDQIKDEFASRDLKTIILAHEVTYPQYPKSLNAPEIIPIEEELLEKIRDLKKMSGFSLQNPSDLCLAHIFVDDILTHSLSAHESAIYLPDMNHL